MKIVQVVLWLFLTKVLYLNHLLLKDLTDSLSYTVIANGSAERKVRE